MPPHTRVTILVCDIDLLVVRHTSKTLLALLNHLFWGMHIAGRKQSFTTWGVHITGKNWTFSSAVEKLSRHCQGTEYQHKRKHTSNRLCRIQKDSHCQHCNKIRWDITLQQGEQQWHQMARRTLGDFHINLQSPMSHIWQAQFQQGIIQEIIQQFGPTQIVLFEAPGEICSPERRVLAIKRSIKELRHLTYFTDFIIVYKVKNSQSVIICKGVGSKQHKPLTLQFQGNHVRTNECVQHGWKVAGPGWDGTSTCGKVGI